MLRQAPITVFVWYRLHNQSFLCTMHFAHDAFFTWRLAFCARHGCGSGADWDSCCIWVSVGKSSEPNPTCSELVPPFGKCEFEVRVMGGTGSEPEPNLLGTSSP